MQLTQTAQRLYRVVHTSGEFVFTSLIEARRQLLQLPGARLFVERG